MIEYLTGIENVDYGVRIATVLQNRLVNSAHRAMHAAIFPGIQPPLVSPAADTAILRQRLEKTRRAFYETALRAGDLEAVVQSNRLINESVSQKRRL